MVEPTIRGGDVALFIDWENFKISLAAGNRTPNLSSLKEEISEHGRVVVAKAYADWVTRAPELRGASQFNNDPPSLYAAGIEPVFVPTRVPSTQASSANGMRTYRVKNSVDVKMTADCIECAHSYPNIGTFVLVSGDSDFLHVVNALRTMGKRVVIIGVSWSTSRRLADQVDSLVLYDKDVDPLAPQPAVLPQHAPQREARNEAPELAEVIRAIEEIIRDDRAAGGNPLLTSIKQRLMRRYPGFDEKKLGFSGFKKLMARTAEDGNIKLIHAGLVDWAIMADEETPESATEESPADVATARPGRRRGGRRRGGQRDADAEEETAETSPDEDEEPAATIGAAFAESPEETAATDFDAPAVTQNVEASLVVGLSAEADADAEESPETGTAAEEPDTGDSVAAEEAAPEPEDLFANDEELAGEVREALAAVSLPAEPEDGQNPERVSDLVVMSDTLERRQGTHHVAFNFLVAEICGALTQGLEAGHTEIAQRWGSANSRDYVGKMLRGLMDGDFFRRTAYSWREEDTGRRRQRRTFNLNRDNELVRRLLTARLGPAANGTPPAEPGGNDGPAPAAPTSDEVAEPEPQPEQEQAIVPEGASEPQSGVEEQPDAGEQQPSAEGQQPDTGEQQPGAGEEQPSAEGQQPDTGEQPDAGDQPAIEPVAEASEPPAPPVEDDLDEVYDEPQPRNVRRRPFTSRLLRS